MLAYKAIYASELVHSSPYLFEWSPIRSLKIKWYDCILGAFEPCSIGWRRGIFAEADCWKRTWFAWSWQWSKANAPFDPNRDLFSECNMSFLNLSKSGSTAWTIESGSHWVGRSKEVGSFFPVQDLRTYCRPKTDKQRKNEPTMKERKAFFTDGLTRFFSEPRGLLWMVTEWFVSISRSSLTEPIPPSLLKRSMMDRVSLIITFQLEKWLAVPRFTAIRVLFLSLLGSWQKNQELDGKIFSLENEVSNLIFRKQTWLILSLHILPVLGVWETRHLWFRSSNERRSWVPKDSSSPFQGCTSFSSQICHFKGLNLSSLENNARTWGLQLRISHQL